MAPIDSTNDQNICVELFKVKRFYLYMKLLQSSTIFKQKNDHEVSCD